MVEMGSMEVVKHRVWGSRWEAAVDRMMQDLRLAVRVLMKSRGFTAIAVLILGLGIGANVAVFSVVDRIVLQPLPFPNADRLVWMTAGQKLSAKIRESAGLSAITFTVDSYEEFQRHNQSYESVTSFNPFYGNSEYTMTGAGEPLGISGVMVAGNFFETLGVQPAMGRLFTQEETHKGGAKAVLISDGLWRRQFHSDPRVVGQVVDLNKVPYTIVGVLPASFDFGAVFAPGMRFDAFEPAPMDTLRTWGNTLAVAGRLKPGVTVGQAQAEADALFVQLQATHKDWQMDYTPKMVGLKEYVSGGLRRSVMVLWLAVGLMLLIVCVNLSSLLVARATARTKEFAMRMALGAGRGRLVRQLLTESLVIAAAGTVLGLALAFSIVNYLARQEAIAVPLLNGVHVDAKALGWTLVLTMTTTLAFGLTPALRVRVQGLQEALKDGGHGTSSGGRPERVRSAMVVAEVALTCVLLVGAGLLLRSFLNTVNEEIGFEPSHAATMRVDYDQSAPGNQRATVLREMLRRVGEIPGVESAGIADMLPLGRNRSWGMASRERGFQKDEDNGAMVRIVTPGYLGAMGMRLRGRDFNWQDTAIAKGENREQAVIINEAADKKPRRRHQQNRECNLSHDQPARQRAASRCRAAATSFLERRRKLQPRRSQRGNDAKDQCRQHRHQQRKTEHHHVRLEVDRNRLRPRRRHLQQQRTRLPSQRNPQSRPRKSQQRTLRQQLHHNPPPRSAQRHPYRYLARPAHPTRQQHVRDIRARNQQHQRNDGHQNLQRE